MEWYTSVAKSSDSDINYLLIVKDGGMAVISTIHHYGCNAFAHSNIYICSYFLHM